MPKKRKIPGLIVQSLDYCGKASKFVISSSQSSSSADQVPQSSSSAYQVGKKEAENNDGYQKKKEKTTEAWKSVFPELEKCHITNAVPETLNCSACGVLYKNIIKCGDCFPYRYSCNNCHEAAHDFNVLHQPLQWIYEDSCYVPYRPKEPDVLLLGQHQSDEGKKYWRSLVVVNPQGFQTWIRFQFCSCEPEAVTLTRQGVWPVTPTEPRVAIHLDLMEMLRLSVVESHISIKSFFEALKWKNDLHLQFLPVKELYRVVSGECFEAYRHYVYITSNLQNLDIGYDDGTECPACGPSSDESTMKIFSLDANFGLVRRKNAGSSVKLPYHQGHFFLDQDKVDKFVDSYTASNISKGCSNFQAGNELRSKGRFEKLEETGVFGACCRHEFPKAFFNLKKGEKLANAVYILKVLWSNMSGPLTVMYDIACKLQPHLRAHAMESDIGHVQLGLPIFHCFGHKMECQIQYSPRRLNGVGLTDGETMERLWSFLRKYSKITKEMQPDHRHDQLVDGLLHYSNKLKRKMVASLTERYRKACLEEDTFTKELSKLVTDQDRKNVEQWLADEQELLKNKRSILQTNVDEWEEEYALKLYEFSSLHDDMDKTSDEEK